MHLRSSLTDSRRKSAPLANRARLARLQRRVCCVRCERFEARLLFSAVEIAPPIQSFVAHPDSPATDTIDLTTKFFDPDVPGTVAEFSTSGGIVDIALTDDETPLTVANFLKYVDSGEYNNTIIHRSVVFSDPNLPKVIPSTTTPANIVQGGGFNINSLGTHIPFTSTVPSEFQGVPNAPGTIAMALSAGDVNSGNTEWYFNVADNSQGLDPQQFTVFGRVVKGLDIINQISTFPTVDLSADTTNSALTDVPLVNHATGDPVKFNNLITINSARSFDGFDLFKFTAASTNPDLLRPVVNGRMLSFQYARGRSGTAQVAFSATGADGVTKNRAFTVTVPDPATGNDAGPVAVDDAPAAIRAGTSLSFRPTENDPDALASILVDSVAITTQPQHGVVSTDTSGFARYVPEAGFIGTDTFQYTVADTNGNVSTPGTVTVKVIGAPVIVTIGGVARRSLTFTEPDGTRGVIAVIGGTADITFAGDAVVVNTVRGIATASGGDASIADISVTASSGRNPSLFISGRGGADGIITLGTVSGPNMAAIVAPTADITGGLKVAGCARILIGSTHDTELDIGPGAVTRLVSINNAVNTDVVSFTGLGIIRSRQWVSTTGFDYKITAADITALVTTGDFSNSIKLTGASGLRAARIGGRVTQGAWDITGTVGALSLLGGVDPSWSLATQNFIQTILVRGDFASDISAGAIGSMLVTGNLTDASIFTGGQSRVGFVQLQRLIVAGNITNSIIRGNGNLGLISAAGTDGGGIFAGMNESLDPAVLPTTIDPFATRTSIASIRVRHFSNTRIAAFKLGALSLGTITAANGGTKDGIAANSIAAVIGALDTGAKLLLLGRVQLKNATVFEKFVTDKGLQLQDFSINLIALPASS